MENNNLMDKSTEIEKNVMAKIKSGQVKLRSKYIFLAEKLGLKSTFALTVLLAILSFNLLIFYLKSSGNLIYLSLGSLGWLGFLESFPCLLVICLVCLIFISGIILKKSDWSHKKPFSFFMFSLLGLIIIAGAALALTDVNKKFQERMGGTWPKPLFSPFSPDFNQERGHGLVGRVINVSEEYILLQTPRQTEKVVISQAQGIKGGKLIPGVFAVFIGHKEKRQFVASQYKIVNEERIEMIRQGIHSRFGQFAPPKFSFDKKIKGCLDNCFIQGNPPDICWQKCNNNQ